jgi:vacuolar-type H+-ATPase subunit H
VAKPSDLLRRFRLIAVPGRAGIAGVPADREALLREELAPVFATLRSADLEATGVVARATSEADARRSRAALEAQSILDEARENLPAVRSAAARSEITAGTTQADALRSAGRDEALRVTRDSASRAASVVDEIVRRVMSTGVEPGAVS